MPTKSLKKNAKWELGLRPYFEYRDLGIVKATKGKVLAHVLRAKSPCTGSSGYHSHDLEFQMNYVLNGWVRVEFEDEGELIFKEGDSWCVCAGTYAQSIDSGTACKIYLKKTNLKTLEIIPLEKLKKYAIDLS